MNLESFETVCGWKNVPVEDREELWDKVCLISDAMIQECRDEAESQAIQKKRQGGR